MYSREILFPSTFPISTVPLVTNLYFPAVTTSRWNLAICHFMGHKQGLANTFAFSDRTSPSKSGRSGWMRVVRRAGYSEWSVRGFQSAWSGKMEEGWLGRMGMVK